MDKPRYLAAQRAGLLPRRSFLIASASLAAAAVWADRSLGLLRQAPKFKSNPFTLGVASGDPTPSGAILWTRLAPDPLNGGGMPDEAIEVSWQVAEDDQMRKVVAQGVTVASPAWAHSVHVELTGLKPARPYWYQFKAGSETSPIGRTQTTPAADAAPRSFKFAFASCNNYEDGLFTAFEHMLREELDLVVHLGDYIYEGGQKEKSVRKHNSKEIKTLEEYRNRFALYKSDPALQAVHAAFPWIVTWDDHEFDNNCAGANSEEKNVNREDFLIRRAAAYKAYYEHMPIPRLALPSGPDMKLYRRLGYGNLAEFSVLDTRQYRTKQPCGDGNKPPCEDCYDPAATLLGAEQERWLLDGLSRSTAKWNVLAQQVMMARVDRKPGEIVNYSMDQWPGYETNRRRILRQLVERKIANPVVLTGDIHTNWVNDLQVDFDGADPKTVATEFVGTSISSGGDGKETRPDTAGVLADNPFVKFYNAERGYVSCEVTPEHWRSDYRVVEYVTRPGAPRVTRASFVVESGKAGAQKVSG